ncbi:hypothetical protein [Agilicoccus flavus]|uniref:hypothetical protein n=1 Tax=Agilicoccus flavus TaxID=2775968 RepID=UPI001CF6DD04|nr:hypothetical protein [Agilicoccus flavus]
MSTISGSKAVTPTPSSDASSVGGQRPSGASVPVSPPDPPDARGAGPAAAWWGGGTALLLGGLATAAGG